MRTWRCQRCSIASVIILRHRKWVLACAIRGGVTARLLLSARALSLVLKLQSQVQLSDGA